MPRCHQLHKACSAESPAVHQRVRDCMPRSKRMPFRATAICIRSHESIALCKPGNNTATKCYPTTCSYTLIKSSTQKPSSRRLREEFTLGIGDCNGIAIGLQRDCDWIATGFVIGLQRDCDWIATGLRLDCSGKCSDGGDDWLGSGAARVERERVKEESEVLCKVD